MLLILHNEIEDLYWQHTGNDSFLFVDATKIFQF